MASFQDIEVIHQYCLLSSSSVDGKIFNFNLNQQHSVQFHFGQLSVPLNVNRLISRRDEIRNFGVHLITEISLLQRTEVKSRWRRTIDE